MFRILQSSKRYCYRRRVNAVSATRCELSNEQSAVFYVNAAYPTRVASGASQSHNSRLSNNPNSLFPLALDSTQPQVTAARVDNS